MPKHCTAISINAPILKTINAILADVTSHAADDLKKLSPFYPHGGIPVPFSEGVTAMCVEAVWQGLKVFENCGIDTELFKNGTMRNIKRTVIKKALQRRFDCAG